MDEQTAEAALAGARMWGLELDPRYRVLAATFELSPRAAAGVGLSDRDDLRVQLLCFPVSTILASLRDTDRVLTFDDAQLVDVSAAFGGAEPLLPLFGQPEPRPGAWAPTWSLEGRSSAPDGRRRTLTVQLRDADHALDVFARFDELELRTSSGDSLG